LSIRVHSFLCVLLLAGVANTQTPAPKVDFIKEVQAVLTAKCIVCHSGDSAQAGLKVHTREDLLRGGQTGPAIIPGQGSDSLLIAKMEGRKGLIMPPSGTPVSKEAIERIRLWIDQGAAFAGAALTSERVAPIAPRTPELPAGTAENPVDRFINAYFKKNQIQPPKLVGDGLFARRVAFDIAGYPLTPEELQAFEAEKTPDKRQRLIDKLLENRQAYAENWITYWNDLLRNDEGVIYHGERKSITQWLFNALTKNQPFDQMVRDLLDPGTNAPSEGFLTGVTWRGVISASQTAPMQAAQNAAQVFLGINIKCAACHDSFINRWKLQDTYGLANMFAEERLELVRCDVPLGTKAEVKFPYLQTKVSFGEELASRRKAAADWFVHPDNGRFARTIVNRYWKQLLGRGIVEPADDMDVLPWDEDLLDWLASDFVANGYDLKHLMRRIMTSRAYQFESAIEKEQPKSYVFRGPRLRRLSAEQFGDTISAVSGSWRVNSPRMETFATYTREWRLKSDPLSRALGRPIRDQVYTERSTEATTLQALELTNGPLLSERLERAAKKLVGEWKPAPMNVFDSKLMRGGVAPVDVDITGAKELWLLIENVDSYDLSRVVAGWADAELAGPSGAVKLESIGATESPVKSQELQMKEASAQAIVDKLPSKLGWNIAGKGFTRFRAKASVDERSRRSDISPAIRFFVFTEKPDPDQLIRIEGGPPLPAPSIASKPEELTERLYMQLFARRPSPGESKIARSLLGMSRVSSAGLEDLLWALVMSPEFQYIR
jgi:hypothetical protein